MMRLAAKGLWIAAIIGFGMIIGLDQAAKLDGLDPGAVHRSRLPELSRYSQSSANPEPQPPVQTVTESRPEQVKTEGAQLNAPSVHTDRSKEHSDSFLNRLGNKLGEAIRLLTDWLIGGVVQLFSSFSS